MEIISFVQDNRRTRTPKLFLSKNNTKKARSENYFNSIDSRDYGFVSIKSIKGKAINYE